jgi:hypothetical protein
MVNSRLFLRLSLLVVLLAGCTPATATAIPAQPTLIAPTATVSVLTGAVASATQATSASTDATAPTALPVATSRGPNLEATDPTTVKLASGGLQLVEFFEFW